MNTKNKAVATAIKIDNDSRVCVECNREFIDTETPTKYYDSGVVLSLCPNCALLKFEKEIKKNG